MRRLSIFAVVAALAAIVLVRSRRIQQPHDGRPQLDGFEVLDRERLARRSAEVFPTAYTTLLSIAQGAALITLVPRAAEQLTTGNSQLLWPSLIETVVTGLSIVVIFYMYSWFVLVFRWSPSVPDTFIPLGLGAIQILQAQSVGDHVAWPRFMAALMIAGGLAFFHSLRRQSHGMFSEPEAHVAIRGALRWLANGSFFGGVIYLSSDLFFGFEQLSFVVITGTLVLLVLIAMFVVSEIALNRTYGKYEMVRWIRQKRRPSAATKAARSAESLS